jgi:hypothetical protein
MLGLCLTLVITFAMPRPVAAQNVDGYWKLSRLADTIDATVGYLKLESADGKPSATFGAGSALYSVKSASLDKNMLRLVVQTKTGVELTFEADVAKGNADKRVGTLTIDGTLYPAFLSKIDETNLDAKPVSQVLSCPPLKEAYTLAAKVTTLRFRAQQSKDPEQRAILLKQALDADAEAKKEAPRLYQEVLAKFENDAAVFPAALGLLRAAKASNLKEADVKRWVATAMNAAKPYGPRWENELALQMATVLVGQEGFEKLAVVYAQQAEKALPEKSSASEQVRVIGVLVNALNKSGQADAAKTYDVRLAKLEDVLDKEYSQKMPGFKGTAYEGRKSKSERAVFMELFTGATCPPCVAADLAFDVLQKSYKPSELVVIQYHMHIPGPDPMTNPDTEARWAYYRETFPNQVRGVPSSMFNGKPTGGGGGPAAFAEKKYEAYREIINPLLEENAGAHLSAQAVRKGDRIDINVKVSDLTEPDKNKKLRILLAEETVRYLGSNKIRLHHNVVRAFPGGVQGTALKDAASRHQSSIHLGNLRTDLSRYLNDFEQNFRPFANPARPMAFNNLRVIAFVQDDSTREILQAVQVPVEVK